MFIHVVYVVYTYLEFHINRRQKRHRKRSQSHWVYLELQYIVHHLDKDLDLVDMELQN